MDRYILAQYVRGPEYRVAPQPEYRAAPSKQPAQRMDMGTCLALTSPAGLPAAIGCGITGAYCGSSLFGNPIGPASCSQALGWCGFALGILSGCYAVGKGSAPEVNPDAAQTAPLERPYEVPPPEPAP